MTRHPSRTRRILALLTMTSAAVLLSQCSDSTSPEPPDSIAILSGNNQFSLVGTQLPEPLTVVLKTADGSAPEQGTVIFQVIDGGGSVSPATVDADEQGHASTLWTLGSAVGNNMVRAFIKDASDKFVVFEAEGSNFFCPEADPTYAISYGTPGHLFHATTKSSLFDENSAGIVRVDPVIQNASAFIEIPPVQFVTSVVFDVAFSPRGDFYLARRVFFPEIVKIETNGAMSHFASLDVSTIDDKVEITSNPIGLLVGVDLKGPFVVGCRDTLLRFPQASFTSGINNDAVAVDPRRQSVDPLGEDVYFINETDARLYRLALDSLTVEARGLEPVTDLTQEQASSARGMVCDDDGDVYILVDSDTTKVILQVTPAGAQTLLIDFVATRGAGDAAGMQRDLAYKSPSTLYTIDTLNDHLLRYDIGGQFFELFTDSLEQAKLSKRAVDGTLTGGEPVGLDVLE